MDHEEVASGSGSSSVTSWGTLEELLLAGAVNRHGTGDWGIVSRELQSRGMMLNMPSSYFTPEVCKSKFDALNLRYARLGSGGGGVISRDKEPENHLPWFDDLRKRRVAQLKRELERHDGSIGVLTSKLKRLKAEKSKQQQQYSAVIDPHLISPVTEASSPSLRESPEDANLPRTEDPRRRFDGDRESSGAASAATAAAAAVVPVQTGCTINRTADNAASKAEASPVKGSNGTAVTSAAAAAVAAVQQLQPEAIESHAVARIEVTEIEDPQAESVDELGKARVLENDKKVDATLSEPVITENLDVLPAANPSSETGNLSPEESAPVADQSIQPPPSPPPPSNEQPQVVDAVQIRVDDTSEKPPSPGTEPKALVTEPSTNEQVKEAAETETLVGNADELLLEKGVEELGSAQEEKEASTSPASSEGERKLLEKSDESRGTTVAATAPAVAVAAAQQAADSGNNAGSPASANELSHGSVHEQSNRDSQAEEKSEVGSQADIIETSPISSRTLSDKKDPKVPGKLQPLLESLRAICAHKFAPLFKQKQESQEHSRYELLIRRHMDLGIIRSKLEEGAYTESLEFFRDMLLMFNNGIIFYPRDSQEHNASVVLRKFTMEEMDRVLQTEAVLKQERPATRKRDTSSSKKSIDSSTTTSVRPTPLSTLPVTVTVTVTAAPVSTTVIPVTPVAVMPLPVATGSSVKKGNGTSSAAMETSNNSDSKSKSASASGVRSSRGGDEDDGGAREGEPEVEGKSKPLKAYGRKNRAPPFPLATVSPSLALPPIADAGGGGGGGSGGGGGGGGGGGVGEVKRVGRPRESLENIPKKSVTIPKGKESSPMGVGVSGILSSGIGRGARSKRSAPHKESQRSNMSSSSSVAPGKRNRRS